jgi:hypothetical protein
MSTLPEQDVDMALNEPVTCGTLGSSYRKDPKMAAKINDNGEYFPVIQSCAAQRHFGQHQTAYMMVIP